MKSIKEKANEYAKEYLFSPIAQRTPNIYFEAGANYVLDLLIEADDKYDTVTECYSALTTVIRELKSNQ